MQHIRRHQRDQLNGCAAFMLKCHLVSSASGLDLESHRLSSERMRTTPLGVLIKCCWSHGDDKGGTDPVGHHTFMVPCLAEHLGQLYLTHLHSFLLNHLSQKEAFARSKALPIYRANGALFIGYFKNLMLQRWPRGKRRM